MTTWSSSNKNISSWGQDSKNSASWSSNNKSDFISTMAGRVGYGAVGRAKVGATSDSSAFLTSWSATIKS